MTDERLIAIGDSNCRSTALAKLLTAIRPTELDNCFLLCVHIDRGLDSSHSRDAVLALHLDKF